MADSKKKVPAKSTAKTNTKVSSKSNVKTSSKETKITSKVNDTVKSNLSEGTKSFGLGTGFSAKKGLGKGLDALLGNKLSEVKTEENVSRETLTLNINLIDPNPDQPRKNFDEDALQELASSIKEHGLIQPIVVQKQGDRYIIVAGERRWRASRKAGLKEVPVYIRDFTPQELFEAALIENIQRQDLNPIEEAEAYSVLIQEYNLKQDEVADRVAKSRVAITNSLRLLNLDQKVRQLVVDGMISGGHARALLAIKDPEQQYTIAMKVFDERLNVRDTEKLIKKLQSAVKDNPKKSVESAIDDILYHDLEEKLKTAIGSKVQINRKKGNKGSIVIEYYSSDELERICGLFKV